MTARIAQFASHAAPDLADNAVCLPQNKQEWFTAAELADLALPGLPSDKRSINRRAKDERWNLRADAQGMLLSRRRSGRGGGTEFHASLLPGPARLALAERGLMAAPAPVGIGTAEAVSQGRWRWYDAQTDSIKAKAEERMHVVATVELLQESGLTRSAAVAEAARRHSQGPATVWAWLTLIDGVPRHDRLPAIAPRFQGGGKAADIDPEIWEVFKSDYLRPEQPTLAICYAKCLRMANDRGISLPSEKAFRRRFEREVPHAVRLLSRKGEEALRQSLPAQRRSVEEYHALELVNMDGHKFDVFVTPEGGGDPVRPIMIGIQDVYSRKILAWRIGTSESAGLTRLVFADLFRDYGIPRKAFLDNGRAFASKWITGGAKSRFRFKISAEEPTGLLTALGVVTGFTLPYRGQSKPIERAWRELCDSVSKSAAFSGAYTGNSPVNKPHNYGTRAVPWADFLAEVERGIIFYNSRARRAGACHGRSCDETFAQSYANAPIGKATAEQMRLALLTGENLRVNQRTGEIGLYGNRYWAPFCGDLRGQRVTVRFDPEQLHQAIHLYDLAGRYLGAADLLADVGFDSVEGSKRAAKIGADHRRAVKELEASHRRLDAAEVAALQGATINEVPVMPEPAVIRPVRHRGQSAAALKVSEEQPREAAQSGVFAAFRHLRPVE